MVSSVSSGISGLETNTQNLYTQQQTSSRKQSDVVVQAVEKSSKVTLSGAQVEQFRKALQESSFPAAKSNTATAKLSPSNSNTDGSGLEIKEQLARQAIAQKQAQLRQTETFIRNYNNHQDLNSEVGFGETQLDQIRRQIRQAEQIEKQLEKQIKQQEIALSKIERQQTSVDNSELHQTPVLKPDASVAELNIEKPKLAAESKSSDKSENNNLFEGRAKAALNIQKNETEFLKNKADDSEDKELDADKDETAADRFRRSNTINEKIYSDYFDTKATAEFLENLDKYFDPADAEEN